MAVYNQNYDFFPLTSSGGSSGTYGPANGFSGNPVIAIICTTAGSITCRSNVSANSFTIAMTAAQRLDLCLGGVTVGSGTFIAVVAQQVFYYNPQSSNGQQVF